MKQGSCTLGSSRRWLPSERSQAPQFLKVNEKAIWPQIPSLLNGDATVRSGGRICILHGFGRVTLSLCLSFHKCKMRLILTHANWWKPCYFSTHWCQWKDSTNFPGLWIRLYEAQALEQCIFTHETQLLVISFFRVNCVAKPVLFHPFKRGRKVLQQSESLSVNQSLCIHKKANASKEVSEKNDRISVQGGWSKPMTKALCFVCCVLHHTCLLCYTQGASTQDIYWLVDQLDVQ